MGTRARAVRMCSKDGEVIKECPTVKQMAEYLGIRPGSVVGYIRKGIYRDGCYFEYVEEWTPKSKAFVRSKYNQRRQTYHEPDIEELGENMTYEECIKTESEYAKDNITLERIHYEMKYGRVGITMCRKLESGKRPMIGTTGCLACTYFRGRCKSEMFVLCAHKSYTGKERLAHYGKKKVHV